MKSLARPELPTASFVSSQAPNDAVDNSALYPTHPESTYKSGKVVQTNGATSLHRAVRLDDLRVPPQNRLEKLKGDRKDQWSIRINDQWRVCFKFDGGDASNVEIVDYH